MYSIKEKIKYTKEEIQGHGDLLRQNTELSENEIRQIENTLFCKRLNEIFEKRQRLLKVCNVN